MTQTLALLRDSALKSNPGDTNVYCNDCFTVAQAVIERVSGMSFAEFVRREIFMKARMSNSSYAFKEGNHNIAAAYAPAPRRVPMPPENANARGTGGITTTAIDLCLFSRALLERRTAHPSSTTQPGCRRICGRSTSSRFSTTDFIGAVRSRSFRELSDLHAGNPGDATPYGLSNRYRTRTNLQYEDGPCGPRDNPQGRQEGAESRRFRVHRRRIRASIAAIRTNSHWTGGSNVVRKAMSGTSFKSSIPADGRILIYDRTAPLLR